MTIPRTTQGTRGLGILRSWDLTLLSFPLSPPFPLRLGTVTPTFSILTAHHIPAYIAAGQLSLYQHMLLGWRPSTCRLEPAPSMSRTVALRWARSSVHRVLSIAPENCWCHYLL